MRVVDKEKKILQKTLVRGNHRDRTTSGGTAKRKKGRKKTEQSLIWKGKKGKVLGRPTTSEKVGGSNRRSAQTQRGEDKMEKKNSPPSD